MALAKESVISVASIIPEILRGFEKGFNARFKIVFILFKAACRLLRAPAALHWEASRMLDAFNIYKKSNYHANFWKSIVKVIVFLSD